MKRVQESSPFLRWGVSLLSLFCVLLLSSTLAFGQTETGQITGTIKDASGGAVVGASVRAKSINTGLARETTANSAGIYTISSLKPDTYEVTIEAKGFEKFVKRIEVYVGSNNDMSVQLTVGNKIETVEVIGSAEAVAVNTENQTLSEVVTARQIEMLPTDPCSRRLSAAGASTE